MNCSAGGLPRLRFNYYTEQPLQFLLRSGHWRGKLDCSRRVRSRLRRVEEIVGSTCTPIQPFYRCTRLIRSPPPHPVRLCSHLSHPDSPHPVSRRVCRPDLPCLAIIFSLYSGNASLLLPGHCRQATTHQLQSNCRECLSTWNHRLNGGAWRRRFPTPQPNPRRVRRKRCQRKLWPPNRFDTVQIPHTMKNTC